MKQNKVLELPEGEVLCEQVCYPFWMLLVSETPLILVILVL